MSQIDTLSDEALSTLRAERDAANAEVARLRTALAEFRAAALAEEAQTGDDEAHRRAWDRYLAAKRALVKAGEER